MEELFGRVIGFIGFWIDLLFLSAEDRERKRGEKAKCEKEKATRLTKNKGI